MYNNMLKIKYLKHLSHVILLINFSAAVCKGTYENNECDVKDKSDLDETSCSSSDDNSMSFSNIESIKETQELEPRIYWEVNGLKQDDPDLIKFIREEILIPPYLPPKGSVKTSKRLNLTNRVLTRRSLKGQFGQSILVEKLLKLEKKQKGKTKGFFIEAGACDGESISNSLYFEVFHDFTGLLVEPNPDFLDALKSKKRNAWIFPHCLSVKDRSEVVQFDAHLFNGGIINTENENRCKPGDCGIDRNITPVPESINKRTLKVQCFPLFSVLMALGNPKVDYFSLDIEGAEYQVLRSVPWDQVDIQVLGVEVAHAGDVFDGSKEEISGLLERNGYIYQDTAGHDQFFVKF